MLKHASVLNIAIATKKITVYWVSMKKIVLMILLMYSGMAFSEEVKIKLQCNIEIKDYLNESPPKTARHSEVFDVEVDGNAKTIMPATSEYFNGVSTLPVEGLVSFRDESKDDKFNISTVRKEKNSLISTQIRIDRDTGRIYYTNKVTLNLNNLVQRGVGDCTKMNPSKNLF